MNLPKTNSTLFIREIAGIDAQLASDRVSSVFFTGYERR